MFLQGGVVGKTDAVPDFVPEALVGSDGNARAQESGGGFLHVLRCLGVWRACRKGG